MLDPLIAILVQVACCPSLPHPRTLHTRGLAPAHAWPSLLLGIMMGAGSAARDGFRWEQVGAKWGAAAVGLESEVHGNQG